MNNTFKIKFFSALIIQSLVTILLLRNIDNMQLGGILVIILFQTAIFQEAILANAGLDIILDYIKGTGDNN